MGAHITPERNKENKVIVYVSPFASKTLSPNESLFKRVHGKIQTVNANSTVNIDFIIPYVKAKFSGAEIFGNIHGNTLNFKVLDTDTNAISGLDVGTYGTNFMLNQFGFNVGMPDGRYANTSQYDADIYQGMVLRCEYTNNSNNSIEIIMNYELHEVK